MKWLFVGLLITTLMVPGAHAARFTSQYCEFELPMGWNCALEGTEWVCQSENQDRQREAIIILAAKIRGDQDSLDHYQNHLRQTKTFMLPGGRTQVSEPKYARVWESTNDKHPWVDALHLASEVPGFFTRYLATTKEDLGIAVTFSVAQDHYDSYQDVFQAVIDSLRVFRRRAGDSGDWSLPTATRDDNVIPDLINIGSQTGGGDISAQRRRDGSGGGGGTATSILLLLLIGGGAFVMMKLKKKKGAAAPAKKKKKKKVVKEDDDE
jgi:hypothetical protein